MAFQLPVAQAPFVHEVSMAERDGFQPGSETHEGRGRAREAGLILRAEDSPVPAGIFLGAPTHEVQELARLR